MSPIPNLLFRSAIHDTKNPLNFFKPCQSAIRIISSLKHKRVPSLEGSQTPRSVTLSTMLMVLQNLSHCFQSSSYCSIIPSRHLNSSLQHKSNQYKQQYRIVRPYYDTTHGLTRPTCSDTTNVTPQIYPIIIKRNQS